MDVNCATKNTFWLKIGNFHFICLPQKRISSAWIGTVCEQKWKTFSTQYELYKIKQSECKTFACSLSGSNFIVCMFLFSKANTGQKHNMRYVLYLTRKNTTVPIAHTVTFDLMYRKIRKWNTFTCPYTETLCTYVCIYIIQSTYNITHAHMVWPSHTTVKLSSNTHSKCVSFVNVFVHRLSVVEHVRDF